MHVLNQKWLVHVASTLLLLLFVAQGLACIDAYSQTYDEAAYIGAGYSYLVRRDFRLMPEHPPLCKELFALPIYLAYHLPFDPDHDLWAQAEKWHIGRQFLYGSRVPADRLLTLARLPNLLLGAALVALVGLWAYRLWGTQAAFVGLCLVALEPNLVAHSSVATTDVGLALFFFLAIYLLWEYVNRPSAGLLVGVGLAVGLGLASKFSAVVLVPAIALVIAGHIALGIPPPLPWERGARQETGWKRRVNQAVETLCTMLAVAVLVILASYFFHGLSDWVVGLYWQILRRGAGQPAYFLGEYSSDGWLAYFAVALLLKTPIGSLVLIVASLLLCRLGTPLGAREALFLLVPPLLFFVLTSLTRVNLGLRYVLPVYPFLFTCASRLATVSLRPVWFMPALLAGLLTFNAVSTLRLAPQQLAYFNELAGGAEEGHRYLSDSNVDWGQDLRGVKRYMEREDLPTIYLSYFGTAPPEYYGIRYRSVPPASVNESPSLESSPPPEREFLAVSVVNLHGIFGPHREALRWLRKRMPVARIGYSIWVYDLTGDADAHWQLAQVYERAGYRNLTVNELRRTLALDSSHAGARKLLDHMSASGS